MKKFNLLVLIILSCITVRSQNVGIGTSNPVARLHVTDSSVLFTGPATLPGTTIYGPPASGAGARMFWYPQKAAFRAGFVDGTQWDKDSIGRYSIALGLNTMAKGDWSVSLGAYTKATGYNSTSLGDGSIASGANATSMGGITHAIGDASTSMGANTTASGYTSTSMGEYTKALEYASTSMGYYTTASGFFSTSMGSFTVASGYNSATMGTNTTARSPWSLVIGKYNDTTNTASVFEIGNGTADNARKNALTVLMNGNIGIGNTNPITSLSFNNDLKEKIAFYTTNATAQYGIGVQSGQLQLYTDVPGAAITFGSGSSTSFSERMRIVNNGTDGMILSGRIIVKSGTGSITDVPGMWTYKADNSALLGFMGTQNNTNMGFFSGITNQWGFVFDAANTRVGIGTSTPSQALQVIGNIIASGTITPSDARYKKNILLIDHPLQKLQQLNGVTYKYKKEEFPDMKFPDITQVGLIAQDVEKVFPQLVFTDDKGYKAVDYVKLIPLLIESLKEEHKQHKEDIKRLEKMIEDLKLSLQK